MKPTKEFIPMDEYEKELWEYENDENYNPQLNEISEEEKIKYQEIFKQSIEKREVIKAMEEVSDEKEFKIFFEKMPNI